MAEDVGELVVRVAMENSSFQQGVNNLNRQMKLIRSEFKNSGAGVKNFGTSLDGLKSKQQMLSSTIQQQTKVVEAYKNKLNESKTTLSNTAQKQVELKEKVNQAKSAYEQSKATLGENAEETKRLKSELDSLEQEYAKNEEKIRSNSAAVDNWSIRVNNAESRLSEMRSELDDTTERINQQENKWNQLATKMTEIGNKFSSVGKQMQDVGKKMTMSITAPILAVGAAASKLGMDFEASMSNVQGLSGATADEMVQLEKAAREAGASTSKTAKDAADALGYMALAGWDAKTSMEALMPVLRLSEAGNLDLARTSDLVTDSMSSLGLSVKELPTYLDQVAKTAASSNTNIDALMEAMIVSGGTFKNLNVPLSEANALLGILANRGLKGSEAGNSLNSIMINLTSGAGQAGVAMKELGLSAFDSNGKFKGMANVLMELKEKTKDMTEEQRTMYLSMIGGKTQISTLQALLSGVGEEYSELEKKVGNSTGALDKMAKTMQNNNKGSITALISAVQELGLKIYNVLKPSIAQAVSWFQNLTNKLNEMKPSTVETIVKIAGLAAALGPVLLIGGKIVSMIGGAIGAFGTFSAAMAVVTTGAAAATPAVGALAAILGALSSPAAVAIAGITALGISVATVAKDMSKDAIEPISRFGKSVSESTKEAVGAFMDLEEKTTISLNQLMWSGETVSEKMKQSIVSNFTEMSNQIIAKLQESKEQGIQSLQEMFATSKNLSDKEKEELIKNTEEAYSSKEEKIKKSNEKVNQIMTKASQEHRTLTKEESAEINQIKTDMLNTAVVTMSKSEAEQAAIMERMKANHVDLSAKEAAEVVKNSIKK
ncbi:phage tail tape measure protein, partial [Clostridioides difficile]